LFHLVVVSGFNIAVVAMAAMWLARFAILRRNGSAVLVLFCVIAYALMVAGKHPSSAPSLWRLWQ
jgi:predicted membrane metal-binding protein